MPLSAASLATRGPRSPSRRWGAAPGGLAELGRGGPGAGGAGVIGMMRTQCLLGLRTFVAFAAKLWSFFIYLLRRQIRTVSLGGGGAPPAAVRTGFRKVPGLCLGLGRESWQRLLLECHGTPRWVWGGEGGDPCSRTEVGGEA